MVQLGRFKFGVRHLVGQLVTHCCCLAAMARFVLASDAPFVPDRDLQVTNHLAAGEFGRALTLANAAPTAAERATLLGQVANAQQAAGDSDAATGTRRRMPRTDNVAKPQLEQPALAGGAMMGFRQLMTLIQQSTPGKWEQTDGEGGKMSPFMTGVKVSPNGLLRRLTNEEQAGQLTAMGLRARKADLNDEISRKSTLRMVSLTRLERAVARRLDEGLPVPESMSQLAGLSQVKYVFVDADSKEIVLAGPADGWQYNVQGQPVSVSDGRPTLQLDDLVTVLRTFARGEAHFGCSINTRDAGVKALKEFVEAGASKEIDASATRGWVAQLQKKLGRQDVEVWGVPGDSRVARVIVEADYRMKLIGIDKLDAGKGVPSYFDLLPLTQQKNPPPMDALRWWLTMQFDGVLHSADKSAFEILGSSVLCQSENQMLTAEGKHVPTGQAEATNRLFAENFTKNYAQLAAKDLVFADTQNIFDLALCSALIKNEHLDAKADWDMGVFAPNGAYSPATYSVPKEIDSVVNHRVYRGRHIVVQVVGGVTADVLNVARDPKLNRAAPELGNVGNAAKAPPLPVGRWWWDAAN